MVSSAAKKSSRQEIPELVIVHFVVLDRQPIRSMLSLAHHSRAFVTIANIVWRVCKIQINHLPPHKELDLLCIRGVTTHKAMFSELPQFAFLAPLWDFLCVLIELIVLCLLLILVCLLSILQ